MTLKIGTSRIMDCEMKVEVIQDVTIRPSSSTLQHLRNTNLSVFDQLVPPIYIPLLLFYPSNSDSDIGNIDHQSLVAEKSKVLKSSLSEALTQFYTLAGQFQYNVSIHCNDHGAAFLTAQVNCPISKILEKPDIGMLGKLLPSDQAEHLLQVQANFFECGGLAIGINISHKAADASTLSKFINNWSEIALGSASTSTTDHVVLPLQFGAAASLFPPLDLLNSPPKPSTVVANPGTKDKCTTRRFLFDGPKISALKSKAATATMPNPTRVEVVSALIWKCAAKVSRSNLGTIRPSAWCQTVNLRKILRRPSLTAQDLLGNVVALVAAKTEEISEADDLDVQKLVGKLRKSIDNLKQNYSNGVSGEYLCQHFMETVNLIMRNDIDSYSCTSWCRFPFYGVNFGWGNPLWIFTPSVDSKNMIILMDTRDDNGLQASVTLKEEDMTIFENNEELLEYASLNPSVI